MAILHPFKALRPEPEFVEEVACVPYDVINTSEARELGRGRPNSFLRVIRPEIDFEASIDEHGDEVYDRGAANLVPSAQKAASPSQRENEYPVKSVEP